MKTTSPLTCSSRDRTLSLRLIRLAKLILVLAVLLSAVLLGAGGPRKSATATADLSAMQNSSLSVPKDTTPHSPSTEYFIPVTGGSARRSDDSELFVGKSSDAATLEIGELRSGSRRKWDESTVQTYERVCDPRTPPLAFSVLTYSPKLQPDGRNCSDTQFLIDKSSILNPRLDFEIDTCGGGQLPPSPEFNIPIDRFVGDVGKLKDEGLIGTKAMIRIGVMYYQSASQEKYFFNDVEVPAADIRPRDTATNQLIELEVPIERVQFPAAGAAAINNRIRVQFSGNCALMYFDWITINIRVARPVLLVHGAKFKKPEESADVIWSLWKTKLTEMGLPNETIDFGPNVRTISTNADAIALKVDVLRNKWKADKLQLVGYSKGGLDAREFVEREGLRDPKSGGAVSQLVQIGTPNAGSPLAILFVSAFTDPLDPNTAFNEMVLAQNPGAEELQPLWTETYNQNHPFLNPRVRYSALAGIYTPTCTLCKDYFQSLAVGEGDLVVPVSSVYALDINNLMPPFPSSGSNRDATHEGLILSQSVFSRLAKEIGRSDPQTPASAEQRPFSPLSNATAPAVTSAPVAGFISSGQQNVHDLSVDTSSNVFFLMLYPSDRVGDSGPDNNVDMTLVSPTGQRFSTQRDDQKIIGGRAEVFAFTTVPTGTWRVEVTAPTIVRTTGIVPYQIVYLGDSPAVAFSGSFASTQIQAGMPLKLLGTVRSQSTSTPITGATVTATVEIPTNPRTTQLVTLSDNGGNGDATANDGVYTANFVLTQQVGYYRVQFNAAKAASGTIPAFSRQDNQQASVSSSQSTIASSFTDFPGNGSAAQMESAPAPPYSELVIQGTLNITKAGNYIVQSEIIDTAGHKISGFTRATFTAGSRSVTLRFDGNKIYRNRVNGRFRLSSVRLLEDDGSERILVDSRADAYETANYQFLDFQIQSIGLANTGAAIGLDTNGNGLFDLLRGTFQIDVRTTGLHFWSAQVVDRNGKTLDVVRGFGLLTQRTNDLIFDFNGRNIGLNGVDGPYTITSFTVRGPNGSLIEDDVLQTPPFLYTQFERCNLALDPTSANASAAGGNGSFAVMADLGCAWSATSGASWITTSSSGAGNGTVNYSVAANSGAARTGTITVQGKIFTVNQAGGTCTYSFSPTSQSFAAAGGSGSFSVIAPAGCAWTALASDSWITTTSNGSGNGPVTFSVSVNPGPARAGTISVATQAFSISQSAGSNSCSTFTFNPNQPIPDNSASGVNIPLVVSGQAGVIDDLDIKLSSVTHTWVGDLRFTLTSPGGIVSTVFVDRPGVPATVTGCSADNFTNTLLDDAGAGGPIENVCVNGMTGAFTPNNQLAVFNGLAANGTWTLNVSDNALQDTGTVNSVALTFCTSCPSRLTQSTSQTVVFNNSASCNNDSPNFFHADNSYWRAFNLGAMGVTGAYGVSSVEFGIDEANAAGTGTTQPVTVRLYTNNGAAFPGGTRTQIAATTVQVADQVASIVNVPLSATIPAGTAELVLEVFTPDGRTVGNRFFIGSNGAAERAPGYISSATCSINTPTTTTALGFPNMHMVMNVNGSCSSGTLQFSAGNFNVNEGTNSIAVTVTRTGSTASPATVDYVTTDGTATQSKDYSLAAGRVTFAAGETSKTFTLLVTDDLFAEPNEVVNVALSNPSSGLTLGNPSAATVTIVDNDSGSPSSNPLDNADARFFVRQHYSDFLSRNPDSSGYDYWSGQITQCGSSVSCRRTKFTDVSNAFYFEQEFQQTGSYVYRLYRAAFGNNQPFPNPNPDPTHLGEEKKFPLYTPFMRDRAQVRGGAQLAQLQLDLANAFVQRSEFTAKYPASLSAAGFVDAVLATITNDSGANLTSQRTALINLVNSSGRGAVMYRLADDNLATNPINNRAFIDGEYNRAFVFTQYAGYLRRNADMAGLLFWLGQVNSAPLRNVAKQHAMVCAFITSTEYQQRFSSVVTRSNAECN